MLTVDKEYYSSPYYFFLRDKGKEFSLYFSSESTIVEARKKDDFVKIPKKKIGQVIKYLEKLLNTKKTKSTKEIKGELEELVNLDGALSNSKIPILDPRLHPKKTMDQTVAAARITNDPISRGYRTYYGESVEDELSEIDMSNAFGFEETQDLDGPETYKYFIKKLGLEPPDAVERVEQQGKNPFKKRKKLPGSDMKITISEIQKQKMIKVVEDILMKKKNHDNSDINKKESEVSKIFKKNLTSLKRQAEKEGITIGELIKMLKSE